MSRLLRGFRSSFNSLAKVYRRGNAFMQPVILHLFTVLGSHAFKRYCSRLWGELELPPETGACYQRASLRMITPPNCCTHMVLHRAKAKYKGHARSSSAWSWCTCCACILYHDLALNREVKFVLWQCMLPWHQLSFPNWGCVWRVSGLLRLLATCTYCQVGCPSIMS